MPANCRRRLFHYSKISETIGVTHHRRIFTENDREKAPDVVIINQTIQAFFQIAPDGKRIKSVRRPIPNSVDAKSLARRRSPRPRTNHKPRLFPIGRSMRFWRWFKFP
jgi:hypothetical protein